MEWPTFLPVFTLALCSLLAMGGAVFEHTDCCNCALMPENVPDGIKPQTMPSPFKIIIEEDTFEPGQNIHVKLVSTGPETFRSFGLAAYTHASMMNKNRAAKGQFTLLTKDYKTKKDCYHQDGSSSSSFAIISDDKTPVRELRFSWKPTRDYDHIEFRATFVESDTKFWVKEKSNVLFDSSKKIPPQLQRHYSSPINTDQCGKTKGCFREPEGCVEPQCLYVVTWTSNAKTIDFELGGLSGGADNSYMAVALSDDKGVGDDTVLVCAHNLEYDTTEAYLGKLQDNYEIDPLAKYAKTRNADGVYERTGRHHPNMITKENGAHEYSRLQCRFTLERNLGSYSKKLKSIGGDSYHLLMFRGKAKDGQPRPIGAGHDEFPLVSKDKVSFGEYSDSYGRARHPLVKAHGCLMIIAWVLFSSVGFLLAKYYQPMWPEKRMVERKYWFTGHFNCMAMVFVLVIISVILIFVEAGGYSKVNDLPYEAHPILGIIILICVLLLPIIGLMRPSPGHRCRPCSNWMYWIFATIANVLAIPNIFIGMDFGKSMVPWWATWILVIWVIFHIVVEITLEVHQCKTHKKNKERRKKHELLKRDYPKQHHPKPEPAGRRFKSFMLTLHLAVTILIVLIMVIVIAVY